MNTLLIILLVLDMPERKADGGVCLVDITDRLASRMILGNARSVGEPGLPGVARAGVDLVETDQCQPREAPATTRISMTMMIATA